MSSILADLLVSFKAGSIGFKEMSIGGQIGPNVNSDEWPVTVGVTVGLDAMVVTLIATVDTSMVASPTQANHMVDDSQQHRCPRLGTHLHHHTNRRVAVARRLHQCCMVELCQPLPVMVELCQPLPVSRLAIYPHRYIKSVMIHSTQLFP